MKKVIFATFVIIILNPLIAGAVLIEPKFSIDPASPAIDGNITPDDVLVAGPSVHTQGRDLGLQDDFFSGFYDNLNALSYGQDPITNPLFFSVDRVAVGLPGTAVNSQAQPGVEEAAGDVYTTLPPFGSNNLFIDEQQLGLTPVFFGDDLDALELDTEPIPYTYFSIDSLSASNGFGTGGLDDDILFSDGTGSFQIFAEGISNIGLGFGDDLDALALWDVFEPGTLNPGIDKALFSISTFSASAFTVVSPADILFTDFTGNFSLWASAADIGLRFDDEVDALDTVPEPATITLMAIGFAGLGFHRYRLRRKNIS
ncbi:MAG: PEP-CTERM sorting domain-containing protein [Deltaproteobacteria bacterium]|nr:PEP-CTERM sorting domain-containing protein [Deltaproteobacteria bacterium]